MPTGDKALKFIGLFATDLPIEPLVGAFRALMAGIGFSASAAALG